MKCCGCGKWMPDLCKDCLESYVNITKGKEISRLKEVIRKLRTGLQP